MDGNCDSLSDRQTDRQTDKQTERGRYMVDMLGMMDTKIECKTQMEFYKKPAISR